MSQTASSTQVTQSCTTIYGIINPEVETIHNEKIPDFQKLYYPIKQIGDLDECIHLTTENYLVMTLWRYFVIDTLWTLFLCKFANASQNVSPLLNWAPNLCHNSEKALHLNLPSHSKNWKCNFPSKMYPWNLFSNKTSFETTQTFHIQFYVIHRRKNSFFLNLPIEKIGKKPFMTVRYSNFWGTPKKLCIWIYLFFL